MTDIASHYGLRTALLEALERDLVGPQDHDELISDAPITTYVAGVLHPQLKAIPESEDSDLPEDGTDDGSQAETATALAAARLPSSIGITFAVDVRSTTTIVVAPAAAKYVPAKATESGVLALSDEEIERADRMELLSGQWLRRPLDFDAIPILVTETGVGRPQLGEGLSLYWRVRRSPGKPVAAVTVVLINDKRESSAIPDLDARFQCQIEITAPESAAAFVERGRADARTFDAEARASQLLYRHAKSFAVGHGCGATWDGKLDDAKTRVATVCMPMALVNVAESNPDVTAPILSFKRAATLPRAELVAELRTFVGGYARWIESQRAVVPGIPASVQDVGRGNLDRCQDVVARLERSIELLERDAEVLRAFRLMNEAMLKQRARADWIRRGLQGDPVADEALEWRPFQLAFVVLCLRGIADPASPDRDIADLLWFPTGGGKTEAYLGLIAFTVFLRRLRRDEDGGGVTALMRYTLRLLTTQQFARAALLICCCEVIRKESNDLGSGSISIGLWVGRGGTPNTRAEAQAGLDRMKSGLAPLAGNPRQLQSCPWCGRSLDSTHYWMGDFPQQLVIGCRAIDCEFGRGLPVYVVDQDIYDRRPTLLLATVDKFASLPWNDECARIFNLGTGDPPPELIVQDELHLISGPLGTLAGLYETAIDMLCEAHGRKPKVLASTATIRRADDQAKALFNRKMCQFPPPALDARDSYFAVEASPERRGNRCFVGCMAPGKSQATLMIRVYARLLQSAQESRERDEIRDAYWTLIGYFNSLRVLGGAMLQVQDDVVDRIKLVTAPEADARVLGDRVIEMTSRVESADIPRRLALMERELPDALDVVLATNMISVGVDVDRLGLMAVMGQPQSTSEYIQATSRVGRRYPGIVVVLFNAMRSRDRSHYESFESYHSALYRQVESTSVTPFSSRARDRGLHAVLVALARLTIPALTGNNGARAIGDHLAEVELIKHRIIARVAATMPEEELNTERELSAVIEMWRARAAEIPDLVYADRTQPTRSLLVDATEGDETHGAFPTLRSLRDVDANSPMQLVGR